MTIQNLEQRLAQKLQEITNHGELAFDLPKPHRLIRQLERLEQRFDQLENQTPSQDKMLISIEKLEKLGMGQLSRRDWKNIAWALCIQFPERAEKLIFLSGGREVLEQLKTVRKDLIPSFYIPLLFSYFALAKNELNQNSNNWLILRDVLYEGLADLYLRYKRPRDWMLILSDYNELLQTQPTKRLSAEFINSEDEDKIPEIASKLHISANSWFWEKLLIDAIKSACELTDQSFTEKIDRLLNLGEKNPLHRSSILTQILDRYATSRFRDQIHERLKQTALTLWGNPQSDAAASWAYVQADTKKMVIQWFVQADLEAFFRLFNSTADTRRFYYWLGYIKQITSTQLFFSSYAINSRRREHQQFLIDNKGRYSQLVGSSSTNNAFMLKIGNIYIVEFSDTGNACYFYNKKLNTKKTTAITDLKMEYGDGYLFKLSHSSKWEDRFNERLAQIGIFPDAQTKFSTDYLSFDKDLHTGMSEKTNINNGYKRL